MRRPVLACLLAAACALAAADPAVFRIGAEPVVRTPPRFGINVDAAQPDPWYVDRLVNQWNHLAACEPILYQYSGICDGGGADFLQHREGCRLSWWDCARSGYWDGATLRVYRMADGELRLLRRSLVARSVCGDDESGKRTEERVYLAESGPEIRAGDLYVLDMQRTAPARPYRKALLSSRGGMEMYDGIVDTLGGARWELDPASPCPEGGSTASLRVSLPAGDGKVAPGVWQWWMIRSDHDLAFNPGKKYRGQVWLRQEGVAGGQVRLQLGTLAEHRFAATGAWQRFEFAVPAEQPAKPYAAIQGDATRLILAADGPGTLWIDNLLIWQDDVEPFAVLPGYVQALKDFQPSVLRLWGGHGAPTAAAWLKEGHARFSYGRPAGVGAPQPLTLPDALRLCRAVGADPWLILNPLWSEDDHRLAMEYLAGPADSAGGRLRAAQGQTAPWTEVFATIRLESANEAWNSIFAPKGWPGQPALYAAIADRQFRELKASPHYRADRIEFVLNGWDGQMGADGWTGQVAAASRLGQRIDVAAYFGGWEKGDGDGGTGAEVYQDKLFATEIEFGRKWLQAQSADPGLPSRLASVFAGDPALRIRCLQALKPRQRWDEAQTRLAGATLAERLAALRTTDAKLEKDLAGCARGLREPLEDPLLGAARLALMRDPALAARSRADLGIDAAAAERLGQILTVLNHHGMIAKFGKERPEVMDALAAAVPLQATEQAKAQLLAARQGREPSWELSNVLWDYCRRRMRAAIAEDAQAFAAAVLAQYDTARVRAGVQTVRYVFAARVRELPLRLADHLLAALRADDAFAAQLFAAQRDDAGLFHPHARALAEGMAASIAGLAAPPPPDANGLALLPALPPAARRSALDLLLAQVADPAVGLAPAELTILRACAAALTGDAGPARALAADAAVIDLLARHIEANLQGGVLREAGEDAALGSRLLAALAARPATGKGFAVYEAGPGYSLPGPGKAPPEDDENIGKSLALGTATLDAFLLASLNGSGPNCYYTFQSGRYWAFQSDPLTRIPYPSWQALGMRNRLCRGDLLRVEPVAVASVDVPDRVVVKTTNDGKGSRQKVQGRKAIPLVACYAFGDGRRLSAILLNRDAAQAHTVRLELPGAPAGPAAVRLLTAPTPMAHNRREAQVREVDGPPVDCAAGATVAVPAGSVAVVTVDLR